MNEVHHGFFNLGLGYIRVLFPDGLEIGVLRQVQGLDDALGQGPALQDLVLGLLELLQRIAADELGTTCRPRSPGTPGLSWVICRVAVVRKMGVRRKV